MPDFRLLFAFMLAISVAACAQGSPQALQPMFGEDAAPPTRHPDASAEKPPEDAGTDARVELDSGVVERDAEVRSDAGEDEGVPDASPEPDAEVDAGGGRDDEEDADVPDADEATDAGSCGIETYYGRCEGVDQTVIYCLDGEIVTLDCYERDQVCRKISEEVGYYCLAPEEMP